MNDGTPSTPDQDDWIQQFCSIDLSAYSGGRQPLGRPASFQEQSLAELRSAFTDEVHAAVQLAVNAMVGARVAGYPSEAETAAVRSARRPTDQERHRIEEIHRDIVAAAGRIAQESADAARAAGQYREFARQLRRVPSTVEAPEHPQDNPGDTIEHAYDAVNQLTQAITVDLSRGLGDVVIGIADPWSIVHLFLGMDIIKDAIHNDQTERDLESLRTTVEHQGNALNRLIDNASDSAARQMQLNLVDWQTRVRMLHDAVRDLRTSIDRLDHELAAVLTPQGQAGPSSQLHSALLNYRAVADGYRASQGALRLLTGPLAQSNLQHWGLLGGAGTPVSNIGERPEFGAPGTSVFERNGAWTHYDQPAQVVEALASGLDLVQTVCEEAHEAEALFRAWEQWMRNP